RISLSSPRLLLFRRLAAARRAVALLALRATRGRAGGGGIAAAVPSTLDDADAGIGANDRTVLADRARADGDELPEVVVERVHLGDFARRKAVGVGERQRGRRVEVRAGRLNGDDEARLLAEARRHRHLVEVHEGR